MNADYEVLSPWAEADRMPLRGISPRLNDLAGKTIGLFCNWKPAARPTLTVVDREFKQRLPGVKTSWYISTEPAGEEIEGADRAKFEEWVKGIDAAITSIGD